MPFPSVCPHVQAEEAVSGSVWTSPPWLSHARHILWDRAGWRGVALMALETHLRRRFRTWLCTHIFLCSPLGLRVIFSPLISTVLNFLQGQLRNYKTLY